MDACERWAAALREWAIPEEIVAAAPESPWHFPPELFRSRADAAVAEDPTPSALRALEALPDGGTVLDVGAGAGAASLPLAQRAGLIVAVDNSEAMLAQFLDAARATGVPAEAIAGPWPDVAPRAPEADVVVCSHVLYNVQDIAPFAQALTEHARHRVVVELTREHPVAWTADLWLAFHGLQRPSGPTASDAVAALQQLGLEVHRHDHLARPQRGGFRTRADAVAWIRRRLCLPSDRDAEVADLLGPRLAESDGLWSAGPLQTHLVTLWWDAG